MVMMTPAVSIPPQTIAIPSYSQYKCPFCTNSVSKQIRFESFEQNTGQVIVKVMDIHSYQNLISNNNAQPHLKDLCRVLECYCPTCYTAFSISKSLGLT
ncbi:MAG: hypothetical protein JHC33_02645 [Ignisphaera sp.]|nr:hypothetical protein [Ignisphaera sp.]